MDLSKLSKTQLNILTRCYYACLHSDNSKILQGLSKRDIEETCSCGSTSISIVETGVCTYLNINGISCFNIHGGDL